MPAGSNETAATTPGREERHLSTRESTPEDSSASCRADRTGVGWTGEGCPPPGVAPEAVRQPSPEQESVETMSVSKGPRRIGAPTNKRGGTDGHLQARSIYCAWVAALRAGEDRAKTRRWLCRVVTETCLDCTAALPVDAEMWRRRPRQRHCDHRPVSAKWDGRWRAILALPFNEGVWPCRKR